MVAPISNYPSFVGAGKETIYGTPVAATVFTPATTIASEDVKNYVPDQAMRGSAVATYAEYPTQGWGTYSYECPVYMDTIGIPLKGLFGDETVTGSGPYVHAISTLNTAPMQPQSYTLVDYNGYETRSFPGGIFSQVELSGDASGLLSASIQATGLPSSAVTKPTQSFSSKTASAGYKGVFTIGGTATSLVESFTLTLARRTNPLIAINASTSPVAIFAAEITATGTMTLIFEDDTFLTPMLSGTIQTFDMSYTDGADILEVHGTSCLFTKAPITRGGNGWMEIAVDFELVANTTDVGASGGYSPCKITLTNTTSGAL